MARVLITGSTTGLGLGAAPELLDTGREVVLHARTFMGGENGGNVVFAVPTDEVASLVMYGRGFGGDSKDERFFALKERQRRFVPSAAAQLRRRRRVPSTLCSDAPTTRSI